MSDARSRRGATWPPLQSTRTLHDLLDDFLDHAMLDLYDLLWAETGSHSQTARQPRIDRTSLYQRLERARRKLCLATVK
jgi:hypothetical protein